MFSARNLMTTPRSIPAWLAPIVEALELDQKRLVSFADIQALRSDLGEKLVFDAVRELSRLGWLRRTGVKGTYEFMPGAAAGPYPSGDPWLVLRAELAIDRSTLHAGANSAAWLLGYAERAPTPHIVVAQTDMWIPRPVRATYRVLTTFPAPATQSANGVPVPTPAELFTEVAQLAPRLQLDAASGWLRRLLDDVRPVELTAALSERSPTTRARAGFLAELVASPEHAEAIAALGHIGRGPFYTGPAGRRGVFSPRWRVYDSGHIAQESPPSPSVGRRATKSTAK